MLDPIDATVPSAARPTAEPVAAGVAPAPGAGSPGLTSVLGVSPLSVIAAVLGAIALIASGVLWQRLSAMQEPLARQIGESTMHAAEARASAKAAQELARETAAKLAVAEIKLNEVAVQRGQLDEMIQSLSRTRDDTLVVDLESALRLAQQQAQLTGSVEPLVAALRAAEQRVNRAAQPALAPVQRALAHDISRITAAAVTDTPGLLARIDELLRLADELPLANAVAAVSATGSLKRQESAAAPNWWQRVSQVVGDEAGKVLRISRIEQPEAALLSPEQSFFVRENFKLRLLNARLGLLARQLEAARADLASASAALFRYFDPASRRTQAAAGLLQQVQSQMKSFELPRADETLAALATAAAGR
ncbi:MAG: uroporphyrinogen-III C-methyltransferase [Burkholderiaceae bacterium]